MGKLLDTGVNLVMGVVAIVVAVVLVRDRSGSRGALEAVEQAAPRYLPEWRSVANASLPMNGEGGDVVLIEFVDFECPACRRYHLEVLKPIREELPHVSVALVHMPLPIHRFAQIAARAVECASLQGRLPEFVDLVFQKQDSLGLKSWRSYGAESRIDDLVGFESCVASEDPVPRIRQGTQWAGDLEIAGTPTIVVDGWLFNAPPSRAELSRFIDSLRSGVIPH